MEAAVQIRDLRFRWSPGGPEILDIPEFSVAAGEHLFLAGPSGSGKTSLLNLLGGIAMPEAGSISVLGQDLAAMKQAERDRFRADHVGFIFQMFNLLPYLSMLENVSLACRFSARRRDAVPGGDVTKEAARLLSALGLDDHSRPVSDLSIGQQQRVAAARALIGSPGLVIADEPTSALDSANRTGFLDLLTGSCREAGATLLFVSHDEELASSFDRRVDMATINRAMQAEVAA